VTGKECSVVQFYTQEQRKSRKEYKCQLCGETIRKGLDYINEHGNYDGRFFEHRRHIHCNAIFEAYCAEPWVDEEYSEDDIWDYVRGACCPEYRNDECEDNPFSCRTVIEKLVPESLWNVCQESIYGNREDGK